MLTADLVTARRRGNELLVRPLSEPDRAEAMSLATSLIAIFRQAMGQSRDDLEKALELVEAAPPRERLKAGLAKLLDDRCTWGKEAEIDPAEARRAVFLQATKVRGSLGVGERFDRARVLAQVAAERQIDATMLERALYADLKGANLLTAFDAPSAATLVDAYERGQVQAVLLRAVRVKVSVRCAAPHAARTLFRRLKFLGLLHTIVRAEGGYDIVIDGPLSLFESVTKYGVRMAQLVPLLDEFEAWALEAEVRWGKQRVPLVFRAGGTQSVRTSSQRESALPDELSLLVRAFRALDTGWKVSSSRVVLDLPGTGLCVPDLAFVRAGETIYFEALGYWSREAVFRRVDLVERGLSERILFAVSSRLRVSEEVLPEDAPAALYVFQGNMKARAIAERLERLASARPLVD